MQISGCATSILISYCMWRSLEYWKCFPKILIHLIMNGAVGIIHVDACVCKYLYDYNVVLYVFTEAEALM